MHSLIYHSLCIVNGRVGERVTGDEDTLKP